MTNTSTTCSPKFLTRGRDGYWVKECRHGSHLWHLVSGRDDVVGGIETEWSDSESVHQKKLRARRMLARARKS